MLTIPVVISLMTAAAAAEPDPCESRWDDQQIKGMAARAQEAFANLDEDGFVAARDEMLEAVPCAGEALSASAAAGYFRVRALDAHLRRSPADLQSNAQAMSEIDPLPPPSSVVPRGHPVRNAWEQARQRGLTPRTLLPVPNGGRLRIDGLDTLDLPTERPAVLQFVGTEGALQWTRVLEPGDSPPAYEAASEDARARYANAVIIERPRKPIELPVIAGVLAAGALGTYAATFQTKRAFMDASEPERLGELRNTNNALVVTAGGLGGAALALGVWTVVVW